MENYLTIKSKQYYRALEVSKLDVKLYFDFGYEFITIPNL